MKKTTYLLVLLVVASFLACKKDTSSAPSSSSNTPNGFTSGDIYTVAGNGTQGYSGDGGQATSAEIYGPNDVFVDGAGNIYIADYGNSRIRKVNTSGIISTIAGNGGKSYSGDGGPATSAQIGGPWGVSVDATGNVYISDCSDNYIRKVNTSGVISTVAGNGIYGYSGDGGPATSAAIWHPEGIAVDVTGNLYIAESNNNCIRKVNTSGIISTIAGDGKSGSENDAGDGVPDTAAKLNSPIAVAVDGTGNIYISVQTRIRKINTSGIISTFAGNGTTGYSGDGGQATAAKLNSPGGIAVDGSGNLYIGDAGNYRIREVNAGGIISTIAGNGSHTYSGDGGPALLAGLYVPAAIAVDGSGNVYLIDLSNRIREVYK